jgi:hypothetical protein
MDTSPDCTGANVKPQLVKNYRGGDIVLPADPAQVIRLAEHPDLAIRPRLGRDPVDRVVAIATAQPVVAQLKKAYKG